MKINRRELIKAVALAAAVPEVTVGAWLDEHPLLERQALLQAYDDHATPQHLAAGLVDHLLQDQLDTLVRWTIQAMILRAIFEWSQGEPIPRPPLAERLQELAVPAAHIAGSRVARDSFGRPLGDACGQDRGDGQPCTLPPTHGGAHSRTFDLYLQHLQRGGS